MQIVKFLTLVFILFAIQSSFLNKISAAPVTPGIAVYFLTPQGSRLLKTWNSSEIEKMANDGRRGGDVSLLKFFETSTESLDWKDRAEIDLLNVSGQKPGELVRLPRYMLVRELVKLHYFRKSGRVSLEVAKQSGILLPKEALEINSISKIELTLHETAYPGIQLKARTNPAASRGEKLFTQNCLSCHSVPGHKPLDPKSLTQPALDSFSIKHSTYKDLVLSPRDVRGLGAYRDALGSEKNGVKSGP